MQRKVNAMQDVAICKHVLSACYLHVCMHAAYELSKSLHNMQHICNMTSSSLHICCICATLCRVFCLFVCSFVFILDYGLVFAHGLFGRLLFVVFFSPARTYLP